VDGADPFGTKGPKTSQAAETKKEKSDQVLVYRVTYDHSRGPCIWTEHGRIIPRINTFTVVNSRCPNGKPLRIKLRFATAGAELTKRLEIGETYELRLTPSQETKKQLEENSRRGFSFLWVNGDEIAVKKIQK
jgi:hypothetical protein